MARINRGPVKRDGKFHVSYMSEAFDNLTPMIANIRNALHGVKYDTIVVTGSSGMLVGPVIARALRKKLLVVRKDVEAESSHSSARLIGELGSRWIFLDDFVSGGETFRRVRDGVRDAVAEMNKPETRVEWADDGMSYSMVEQEVIPFETELVGYVQYQKLRYSDSHKELWTPWDEDAVPGCYDKYLDDTPAVIAQKAKREAEDAARLRDKGERLQRQADLYAELTKPTYTESSSAPGCGTPGCIVCSDLRDPAPGLVRVTVS